MTLALLVKYKQRVRKRRHFQYSSHKLCHIPSVCGRKTTRFSWKRVENDEAQWLCCERQGVRGEEAEEDERKVPTFADVPTCTYSRTLQPC